MLEDCDIARNEGWSRVLLIFVFGMPSSTASHHSASLETTSRARIDVTKTARGSNPLHWTRAIVWALRSHLQTTWCLFTRRTARHIQGSRSASRSSPWESCRLYMSTSPIGYRSLSECVWLIDRSLVISDLPGDAFVRLDVGMTLSRWAQVHIRGLHACRERW